MSAWRAAERQTLVYPAGVLLRQGGTSPQPAALARAAGEAWALPEQAWTPHPTTTTYKSRPREREGLERGAAIDMAVGTGRASSLYQLKKSLQLLVTTLPQGA